MLNLIKYINTTSTKTKENEKIKPMSQYLIEN